MFHFFPRSANQAGAPLFRLDATTEEEGKTEAEPTKVPIDGGEQLSDFLYLRPDTYRVTGKISPIMPFAAPRGVAGVTALIKRAQDTIRLGELLTCVFAFEVVTVALKSITRSLSHAGGFGPVVSLEFQEIVLITPDATTIPASRFRRAVRRQAAPRLQDPQIDSLQVPTAPRDALTIGVVKKRPDGIEYNGNGFLPGVNYTTDAEPLPP